MLTQYMADCILCSWLYVPRCPRFALHRPCRDCPCISRHRASVALLQPSPSAVVTEREQPYCEDGHCGRRTKSHLKIIFLKVDAHHLVVAFMAGAPGHIDVFIFRADLDGQVRNRGLCFYSGNHAPMIGKHPACRCLDMLSLDFDHLVKPRNATWLQEAHPTLARTATTCWV